jgi:hypothetical protein
LVIQKFGVVRAVGVVLAAGKSIQKFLLITITNLEAAPPRAPFEISP